MKETDKGSNDSSTLEYWANLPAKDCAEKLSQNIKDYYVFLNNSGKMTLWSQSYRYFFGGVMTGGRVGSGGESGEYRTMNVNHYRNILLNIKQLAAGSRPAWEPRAINSDPKSQKQTILARGLLDYYMREKRVERDLDTSLEYSLVFGEGFIHSAWDATDGKAWAADPDTGAKKMTGDISSVAVEPVDLIRDPLLDQWRKRTWVCVRDKANRYELMAKYPEYAEQIAAIQAKPIQQQHYRYNDEGNLYDSDLITTFQFYHAKNDACPDGRQMLMLEDEIVLTDGPLAYRKMPVHRLAANEINGSPFGYTVGFDLQALQQNYDSLWSAITSNQEMFAVQNILVPRGANFNVSDMGGQMKAIEFDPSAGEPKALQLLATPPEVFEQLKNIENQMMTLSGINSVSRGDPQASLKSGAALALVQSMAIQFNQALQGAYVRQLEDVGTAIIENLQDYAAEPRIAAISGKYNKSMVTEFNSDDLDSIDRVIVDAGNPLMQTVAGKMELAQTMLQAGMIHEPDELLSVINTGNLQPMIQGRTFELIQLAEENEELKEGRPVTAIITDDHVLHINEHKSVLADVASRRDPKIVAAALAHLQQHIDLLKSPDYQQLLQLMHQPALGAPPAPPGAPGAAPGGQPQGPGAPAGQGALPGPGNNANGQVAAMQPHQPNMPKNAMTGKPFNPQTGGLQ